MWVPGWWMGRGKWKAVTFLPITWEDAVGLGILGGESQSEMQKVEESGRYA